MDVIVSQASRLRRIFIIGLISLSLWCVTLAVPAHASDANDYSENQSGGIESTERYDQIQPEKGGMNNFDDIDPRQNANKAKAKTLIDSAKRRNIQASDPLEPVRETVGEIKERIGEATNTITDKAGDQTDKVTDKAADAIDRVGRRIKQTRDDLTN